MWTWCRRELAESWHHASAEMFDALPPPGLPALTAGVRRDIDLCGSMASQLQEGREKGSPGRVMLSDENLDNAFAHSLGCTRYLRSPLRKQQGDAASRFYFSIFALQPAAPSAAHVRMRRASIIDSMAPPVSPTLQYMYSRSFHVPSICGAETTATPELERLKQSRSGGQRIGQANRICRAASETENKVEYEMNDPGWPTMTPRKAPREKLVPANCTATTSRL
ncbi:hypothetical protein RJ55_02872 [Drechmeria coniospora]|nr:hypothetical protein RJ55_02872 [Drechmeria coniospora]